jgi:hypothetical protein
LYPPFYQELTASVPEMADSREEFVDGEKMVVDLCAATVVGEQMDEDLHPAIAVLVQRGVDSHEVFAASVQKAEAPFAELLARV